jgi:uncharacterized protein (TIGR02996 family)
MHAAFLRAILEEPDEDVHRLAYADWLEEHAGAVPCGQCVGHGWYWSSALHNADERTSCGSCRGTGRAPDGNATRAEFIRVQCELEPLRTHGHGANNPHGGDCETCLLAARLERRERKLLNTVGRREMKALGDACGGFIWTLDPNDNDYPDLPKVRFRRGFIEEVTLPCATFLGGPCPLCHGSPVSPGWTRTCLPCSGAGRTPGHAGSLFSVAPITRVTLGDREPHYIDDNDEWHGLWMLQGHKYDGQRYPFRVPWEIYLEMRRQDKHTRRSVLDANYCENLYYDRGEVATDILSNACVAHGRSLAGLPAPHTISHPNITCSTA